MTAVRGGVFDVFHLPAFDPAAHTEWLELRYPHAVLRAPLLTTQHIEHICTALLAARARAQRDLSCARIIAAIDAAAARLRDPADPAGQVAHELLPVVTGYSAAMVAHVLERMTQDWMRAPLEGLLEVELGGAAALEAFIDRPDGSRTRAIPPHLGFHVLAGNVPGVAVTSLIRGLLLRSAVLGKTARDEPLLPALFARVLHEIDAPVGDCLAVTYWPGGTDDLETAVLARADCVVLYGSASAVAHLRARVPAHTRVLEHAARLSFAMVGRTALATDGPADTAARAVARALTTFDQQGCVSPHVVYVEEGGMLSVPEFASRVADATADLAARLPRGRLTAEDAVAIRNVRAEIEFRAIAGADVRAWHPETLDYTILFEADPRFRASCLSRTLWIKPVADLADVPALVQPHAHLLQSVGCAGIDGERALALAAALADAGVTRVTAIAQMPWPPATWHHDGRGPLRELVSWLDLEPLV